MKNQNAVLAGAAMLLVLLASIDAANAITNTQFKGSRDQVRAACTGSGTTLVEGRDHSTCLNSNNNTGVTCDDSQNCWGSGPRRASDEVVVPLGSGTPMSLSESTEGGSAPTAGAPTAPVIANDTSGGGEGEVGRIN